MFSTCNSFRSILLTILTGELGKKQDHVSSSSKGTKMQQKCYKTDPEVSVNASNVKSPDELGKSSDFPIEEETLDTVKLVEDATSTSVIVHIDTTRGQKEIPDCEENPSYSPKEIDCTTKYQNQMSLEQVSKTDVVKSISITIDNDESCEDSKDIAKEKNN